MLEAETEFPPKAVVILNEVKDPRIWSSTNATQSLAAFNRRSESAKGIAGST
jgi:hypothetical protein